MQEDYEREKLAKQQYSKGWSYEHGIGVSVDKNFALVWYEKAADLGYEMAARCGVEVIYPFGK